jgi:hypothetical protein
MTIVKSILTPDQQGKEKKYFLISYSYHGSNGLYGHGEMSIIADIFPPKKVIEEAVNAAKASDQVIVMNIYQFPSELEYRIYYEK